MADTTSSGMGSTAPERFIGRDLGSVTTIKLLGKGAMGMVFLGFQRTLKRQVAVKVLPKTAQTTAQAQEQFHKEAEIVASLSHPNIVPIFEVGEDTDCYYQVLQVVRGKDLESVIGNRLKHPIPAKRVFSVAETIAVMRDILDGLGYAHDKGLIHQDIKPANILVEEPGQRPLIADFGIARTRESQVAEQGIVLGSPLYIAPEKLRRQDADHRSDIYAVGVMLFKMLVGELPLAVRDPISLLARKATAPDTVFTKKPSDASASIDIELENIILRGMAAKPDERYQTCAQFRHELDTYGLKGKR